MTQTTTTTTDFSRIVCAILEAAVHEGADPVELRDLQITTSAIQTLAADIVSSEDPKEVTRLATLGGEYGSSALMRWIQNHPIGGPTWTAICAANLRFADLRTVELFPR